MIRPFILLERTVTILDYIITMTRLHKNSTQHILYRDNLRSRTNVAVGWYIYIYMIG